MEGRERGLSCAMFILRNANVTGLCHLFMPLSLYIFIFRYCNNLACHYHFEGVVACHKVLFHLSNLRNGHVALLEFRISGHSYVKGSRWEGS